MSTVCLPAMSKPADSHSGLKRSNQSKQKACHTSTLTPDMLDSPPDKYHCSVWRTNGALIRLLWLSFFLFTLVKNQRLKHLTLLFFLQVWREKCVERKKKNKTWKEDCSCLRMWLDFCSSNNKYFASWLYHQGQFLGVSITTCFIMVTNRHSCYLNLFLSFIACPFSALTHYFNKNTLHIHSIMWQQSRAWGHVHIEHQNRKMKSKWSQWLGL